MLYVILTACIFDDSPVREREYITAYSSLYTWIHLADLEAKIIIIENNGQRPTYLDDLGCDVLYTTNNQLPTANKGIKELQDIKDCIEAYSIPDDAFIVKLTGRYIIDKQSPFMEAVKAHPNADCIIKFASYANPCVYSPDTCISGLLGMRCRYMKQIELPTEDECAEWKWAAVTSRMKPERVIKLAKLGVCMNVGSELYCFA